MKYVKIEDVASICRGASPRPISSYITKNADGINWVKIGDVEDNSVYINKTEEKITKEGAMKSRIVKKGDFILSNSMSFGRPYILNIDGCVHDGWLILSEYEKYMTQKYFYYVLRSNNTQEQFNKYAQGATVKNLNSDIVRKTWITIYDFSKQQEIVSILDTLNNIIDADKRQLDLLNEVIKSRFIEMFDSIEKKVQLKEICSIEGGYSFKSTDICSDGIKLLQIGNVALNDLDWSTTNYLPVGFEKQRPNFLLKENDIVVALTRPIIQSLGNVKACIVKQEDLPCLLNQRVGKIQCIDGKSVVNYIFGCLMTEDFTEYVKSCCTGCSQPNISTKDIESYQVPNVNIESQLAFSNFKELIDKSKFNVQLHLDLMQELLDKKMEEFFGEG